MAWELEFFRDADGREPVVTWLDNLDAVKREAAKRGLSIVLATQGPAVVGTEYGKNLGDGLFEFRLRIDAQVILQKHAPHLLAKYPDPPHGEVLLRVYFHPHRDKLILLLGGYDRGRDPSDKAEQKQIKQARKRLKQWKGNQAGRGSRFRTWWVRQVRGKSGDRA